MGGSRADGGPKSRDSGGPAPQRSPRTGREWLRALASVAISAALFVLSFPPSHYLGLAWVALVPLFVTLRRCGPFAALFAAGLWGMLAAWGTTDWLPPTLTVYYHQPYWVGLGLFLTASFLMGALDYMGFAAVYRDVGLRGRSPLVLVAGAAWALAEFGRDRLFTGNPWGLVGYSQLPLAATAAGSPSPWLAERVTQVADLGGVYAVSFVVVAVNALAAEAWLAFVAPKGSRSGFARRRRLLVEGGCCATLVGAALGYGSWRLATVPGPESATSSVAVVQANLDLGSRWDPALYGRNLEAYLTLTRSALEATPASLVVWPENAMTFFVDTEKPFRTAIAGTTGPHDAQLLAGAPRQEGEPIPTYYNSAFLLAPDGEILSGYDKEHLLPFAEYFPFSSVGLLQRSFGRVREFTAGERAATAPLATAVGRAGILICNEAMFPYLAGRRVRDGAELLINLSNDSWVDSTEFAEHQFALVTMRAIEQRRWLVRASTSGPSAVVDPRGRVQHRTEPFTSGFFGARVEARSDRTFYGRFGDVFVWMCAGLVLAALLIGRRGRGR